MVFVGSLGVAGYGEFKVFSSSVGLNIKHIYPWWIWLSDSIFINVGVVIIFGGLNKVGPLFASFLALAYLVEMSNFMAVFALFILSWIPLQWLVFLLSTSHALVLHSWEFSRLMTRIREDPCAPELFCP